MNSSPLLYRTSNKIQPLPPGWSKHQYATMTAGEQDSRWMGNGDSLSSMRFPNEVNLDDTCRGLWLGLRVYHFPRTLKRMKGNAVSIIRWPWHASRHSVSVSQGSFPLSLLLLPVDERPAYGNFSERDSTGLPHCETMTSFDVGPAGS
jgi:hypothetical protein